MEELISNTEMIIKKYLILVIIGILLSCSAKKNAVELSKGKLIIEGEIEVPEGDYSKVISLKYFNAFDNRTTLNQIIDSTGYFKFKAEIYHSQDVLLSYGKSFTRLVINPHDSVNVKISTNFQNDGLSYEISGNNPQASKDFLVHRRFYRDCNIEQVWPPDYTNSSIDECFLDIKQRISLADSILTAFNKSFNPSDEFMSWANKDIIFSKAFFLLIFKNSHPQFRGDLFAQSLFPVDDDEAIISSSYGHHLGFYSSHKYLETDSVIQNLTKEEKFQQAYELCLSNILENEAPGLSRDIMCYLIFNNLFNKSYEVFSALWKDAKNYISNKELIALLSNMNEEVQSPESYSISKFDLDTKVEKEIKGDFIRALTEAHHGKVIYIDFWSTSCGPCIREIPHALALQEYYKNMPIIFTNVCLLSKRKDWKELIQSMKWSGENYYFNKDQSHKIRSELKLYGFPTYLIVDKEGNIVNSEAPRPSSKTKSQNELNKWINN